MTMCIVTRSQPGALATATELEHMGYVPLVVPAAIIIPTDAGISTDGVQALLMTSAAAARNARASQAALNLPVYAVGDATAQAASDAGFRTVISAGGDGAALAVLAADRMKTADGALLHLRGSEIAGDVTAMLETCGFQTRFVEVYMTRDHPDFGDKITQALANNSGFILLHSPAGTRRLLSALGQAGQDLGAWCVVAISPACLTNLQNEGFGKLIAAEQPDEMSLLAALAAH